jgi:cardiolipin synthase
LTPSYIPFATSGYPARPGNRVEVLVGGPAMFGRIGAAVDRAQRSIWVTVAFYRDDFRFPDGRGALFDALDRAVARGVDVRLLVWRPNPEAGDRPVMFGGTPAQREMLAARGSRVKIRWDRAEGKYCQHQKSWLIDAGEPSETAFVGGANMSAGTFSYQDLYAELAGPAATDVHRNFVQRWNEASERHAADGNWACDATDVLPVPEHESPAHGPSTVQIGRMLRPGRHATAADGERSVLEQYQRAIGAARRTIYLENQAIPIMDVAGPLIRALERGVDVILLVPTKPEPYVFAARHDPAERPRFEGIESLGRHPNFLMAGLGPTYVHAKMAIVDDAWATVGSCNLHAFSLHENSEMNAAIWDAEVAGTLRRKLFAQHLDADIAGLDDRAAFARYRRIARAGTGRVAELAPERYGVT